jgi:hypothetical protein
MSTKDKRNETVHYTVTAKLSVSEHLTHAEVARLVDELNGGVTLRDVEITEFVPPCKAVVRADERLMDCSRDEHASGLHLDSSTSALWGDPDDPAWDEEKPKLRSTLSNGGQVFQTEDAGPRHTPTTETAGGAARRAGTRFGPDPITVTPVAAPMRRVWVKQYVVDGVRPDGVTKVADNDGDLWSYDPSSGLWEGPDDPQPWLGLLRNFGPLTEVLDS